jgi:DNA-binding XRE family transcriptional regulator
MNLSKNIKELRIKNKYTQEELAEMLVSKQYLDGKMKQMLQI